MSICVTVVTHVDNLRCWLQLDFCIGHCPPMGHTYRCLQPIMVCRWWCWSKIIIIGDDVVWLKKGLTWRDQSQRIKTKFKEQTVVIFRQVGQCMMYRLRHGKGSVCFVRGIILYFWGAADCMRWNFENNVSGRGAPSEDRFVVTEQYNEGRS